MTTANNHLPIGEAVRYCRDRDAKLIRHTKGDLNITSGGFNEFVIVLGYKSEIIKDYFLMYKNRSSSPVVDTETGGVVTQMERLAAEKQLLGYKHRRFWQCMDTLRDIRYLDALWAEGKAPWKNWR